jgi:hypothetical protein
MNYRELFGSSYFICFIHIYYLLAVIEKEEIINDIGTKAKAFKKTDWGHAN